MAERACPSATTSSAVSRGAENQPRAAASTETELIATAPEATGIDCARRTVFQVSSPWSAVSTRVTSSFLSAVEAFWSLPVGPSSRIVAPLHSSCQLGSSSSGAPSTVDVTLAWIF